MSDAYHTTVQWPNCLSDLNHKTIQQTNYLSNADHITIQRPIGLSYLNQKMYDDKIVRRIKI